MCKRNAKLTITCHKCVSQTDRKFLDQTKPTMGEVRNLHKPICDSFHFCQVIYYVLKYIFSITNSKEDYSDITLRDILEGRRESQY